MGSQVCAEALERRTGSSFKRIGRKMRGGTFGPEALVRGAGEFCGVASGFWQGGKGTKWAQPVGALRAGSRPGAGKAPLKLGVVRVLGSQSVAVVSFQQYKLSGQPGRWAVTVCPVESARSLEAVP